MYVTLEYDDWAMTAAAKSAQMVKTRFLNCMLTVWALDKRGSSVPTVLYRYDPGLQSSVRRQGQATEAM
jgi:hypothetical protein